MTFKEKVGLWILDLVIALPIPLMWTDALSGRHLLWWFIFWFGLRVFSWTEARIHLVNFGMTALGFVLPIIVTLMGFVPMPAPFDEPLWLALWLSQICPGSALLVCWVFQEEYQERFQYVYVELWMAFVDLVAYLAILLFTALNDPRTRTRTVYGQTHI